MEESVREEGGIVPDGCRGGFMHICCKRAEMRDFPPHDLLEHDVYRRRCASSDSARRRGPRRCAFLLAFSSHAARNRWPTDPGTGKSSFSRKPMHSLASAKRASASERKRCGRRPNGLNSELVKRFEPLLAASGSNSTVARGIAFQPLQAAIRTCRTVRSRKILSRPTQANAQSPPADCAGVGSVSRAEPSRSQRFRFSSFPSWPRTRAWPPLDQGR